MKSGNSKQMQEERVGVEQVLFSLGSNIVLLQKYYCFGREDLLNDSLTKSPPVRSKEPINPE